MKTPQTAFEALLSHYGPQGWWPVSENPDVPATYQKRNRLTEAQQFEIAMGAILTQNVNWKNAARALSNLKQHHALNLQTLQQIPARKLGQLITPAGFFNQKAIRIKQFCGYVSKHYDSFSKFLNQPRGKLRNELLELHGIGKETADSIILYAALQPIFVIDAYTRRWVERFFGEKLDYAKCQDFFTQQLPAHTALFNEYHALVVTHAQIRCKKKPDCTNCVLQHSCRFGKNEVAEGDPSAPLRRRNPPKGVLRTVPRT